MIKNKVKELLILIIACFLTGFASNSVLKPNGLNTSGTTGLAIVLEALTGINYTYIYYVFTFIILICAFIIMGKNEVGRIILLSILYPTTMLVLQTMQIAIVFSDPILAIMLFSILFGIGVGLALKLNYSYGGTDTIAMILNKTIFSFISLGTILLFLDGLVIVCTGFVFGIEVAMYALIAQFIFTKIIDYVMFGIGTTLYKHEIISEHHEEISQYIMANLARGVTIRKIVGAYTGQERIQLSCVCSPKQSVIIRKYLQEIDKNAYVEVLPIMSVWGTGVRFKSLNKE